MSDIINTNGSFVTLQQLHEKHNIGLNVMNTMKYNSLKSAIPKTWINILKLETKTKIIKIDTIHLKVGKKPKLIEKLQCKDFYNLYISSKKIIPTAVKKWETLYEDQTFEWDTIFCLPYKINRETSLQSLHYKIINRYIPCRENLHKWKKAPTNTCLHCNDNSIDTIEHYLYLCPNLKSFWQEFNKWWKQIYSFHIRLSILDILFGVTNNNDDMYIDVLNFCLLYIKGFIVDRKVYNKECRFIAFVKALAKRLDIEHVIAVTNNSETSFFKMWSELYNGLKNHM